MKRTPPEPNDSPYGAREASLPPPPRDNLVTAPPVAKRRSLASREPRAPRPRQDTLPPDLGEFITRDSRLVRELGWEEFVARRRGRGDFADLLQVQHPARRLLRQYKHRGAPVVLADAEWPEVRRQEALQRGAHTSTLEHIPFLKEEFASMVAKGQWVILPYSVARDLPDLRLSPPGVKEERDRRPRWLGDYSYSKINYITQPIAPLSSMQYGRTLDRVLREIVYADPRYGPVHLMKADVSDGFYRIPLRPKDAPKLALVFPPIGTAEPLVAIPLVLPMGWTNSPPFFCAASETIADLANAALVDHRPARPHNLDGRAEGGRPNQGIISGGGRAAAANMPAPQTLPRPLTRDPNLSRKNPRLLAYVDVFVDDFLALAQGPIGRLRNVRRHLFHAIDRVLRPLDEDDAPQRKEVNSLKKLDQGDGAWATQKEFLGWDIDTVGMTIRLPERRVTRLRELLDLFPPSKKRTSVKVWRRVLGELRSMALAIPGARGLFSQMQEALRHVPQGRIALSPAVHQALADFRWMLDDLAARPTRLYELVPLSPTLDGYHDASGTMCGGVLLPGPGAIPRALPHQPATARPAHPGSAHPIIWRATFPPDIVASLVSSANPSGSVTNSDLELAGGILQHDCAAACFDIRERTILSRTDNTAALWWQRKGSATSISAPAHLLRLQAMHQRHHRYVPRHDFVPGVENDIADLPSRSSHLSDAELLTHYDTFFPQNLPWRMWQPPAGTTSSIASALRRTMWRKGSLLRAPPPPTRTGPSGTPSVSAWPSTPYLSRTATQCPSSTPSHESTARGGSVPVVPRYAPARWRTPSDQLGRRSRHWGPATRASQTGATWTSASASSTGRIRNKTHLRDELSRSRFKSSTGSRE